MFQASSRISPTLPVLGSGGKLAGIKPRDTGRGSYSRSAKAAGGGRLLAVDLLAARNANNGVDHGN